MGPGSGRPPLPVDESGLIDVKALLRQYTVDELNGAADDYYKDFELKRIDLKPFTLPSAQHLFAELAHMIGGLELVPGDKVLDFGCGIGWASRMLNACGCEVVGMDVSGRAVAIAEKLSGEWRGCFERMGGSPLRPLSFKRFDGHTIELASDSVDRVFVLDAFHHFPNPAAVLGEFHRVLKPGGIAGFCEPGPNHSRSPEAQLEMKMYKVIENDVNPRLVWHDAKAIGFEKIDLFVSPLIGQRASLDDYEAFPNGPVREPYLGASTWRARNFPIFFLHKGGAERGDSRRPAGLAHMLELAAPVPVVNAGSEWTLSLRVKNTGPHRWLPSGGERGSVNIGILVSDGGALQELRRGLSETDVAPGETREVRIVLPPLAAGRYTVEIDLLAEFVCWFGHQGSKPLKLELVVS